MKNESVGDLRRLYHEMTSTVGTLESIDRPIANCSDLFVHLVAEMLDPRSRREWETLIGKTTDPPDYETLCSFIECRVRTLEALHPVKTETSPAGKPTGTSSKSARAHLAQRSFKKGGRCSLCQGDHYILFCGDFQKKTPDQKKECAESSQLCFNCFGKHRLADCLSKKSCAACSGRHHSTMHDAFASTKAPTLEVAASHHAQHRLERSTTVLLATARLDLLDRHGYRHRVRALVDQGSEVSFITEALTQRLRLRRTAAPLTICGIGGQQSTSANGKVNVHVFSRRAEFNFKVTALILPQITAYTERMRSTGSDWPHIHDLDLADPEFNASDPVELLLGADTFGLIIEEGLRKGGPHLPIAQQTALGWILSGITVSDTDSGTGVSSYQCTVDQKLASLIGQFWEQEELPQIPTPLTAEELRCEDLYTRTLVRMPEGRYMVRLPVANDLPPLSDTRKTAYRSLHSMERRFRKDDDLRRRYTDFMLEYEELRHMTATTVATNDLERLCYLPHHGVMKTSGEKKIRVVFNGSSRLQGGESLNAFLLAGPNLLPALPDVIMRWRLPRFAIVADIEKMYRQILVHPEDRNLQRIVWRQGDDQPVKEYHLNTVTYGLTCAPYLAIRTLRQLASDEEDKYPKGAVALRRDCYVDDILTGADTMQETASLRDELNRLCAAGGFPLRKWAASDDALLESIPVNHRQEKKPRPLERDTDQIPGLSTLGLQWHPREDAFSFRIHPIETNGITKRTVLSNTARLFDPLGWLAPVVIAAKILIQSLWLQHLDWDDPVASEEEQTWTRIERELPMLGELRVPRWLHTTQRSTVELHGFADASERAYAAVVYARVRCNEANAKLFLLAAKTRVAPLKQVSLPRLELCAADMLARLATHVGRTMELTDPTVHLWSDSTVALAWIQGHPSRWKTFVANRVANIQRMLPQARWHHVSGDENPADCASRGLSPAELIRHALWWRGPPWLEDEARWPQRSSKPSQKADLPEQRTQAHTVAVKPIQDPPLLERFSRLQRLLRVTAWCRRWTRVLPDRRPPSKDIIISPQEIETSRLHWVQRVQEVWFAMEKRAILQGRPISGRSPLIKLTPFIDENGLLRLGGRLKHSLLRPDERHPILLPPASHLTALIIDACHRRTMHGGVQLTLGTLRRQYWIPGGRNAVRSRLHRCVTCARWRAASPRPLMGNLPSPRVIASRPFTHTGVDYAGPVQLRTTKGRGQRSHKAFLAIFVCFSTRAVHLEVASDYSTDAFLAAFRRFVARRGLCHTVYSDRGTNFVGADAQLRAFLDDATKARGQFVRQIAAEGVRWSFNPPAAPHFGGLWEAAVKSVKHHLRRVIGDTTLTFEEMTTVLTQIEACLNSRPLQPLTDDPDDVSALTPGHFLIGTALNAVPEPSLTAEPATRLSRWRQLQQMRDHFWQRWSQEYLHTLAARQKWWRKDAAPRLGDLCLLRGDHLPPTKWPLARITALHPGEDGEIRVVTARTATTTLKRPVVKIILLPIELADTDP